MLDISKVYQQTKWVEGEPETSFWLGLKIKGRRTFPVFADRCPQCGTLELHADENA